MLILLILLILLVAYFYWKSKQALNTSTFPPKSPDILWEAPEFFSEMSKSQVLDKQKEWFTEKRWLSDQEIGWALSQVLNNLPPELQAKYKVLESTQFMFAKESLASKDPSATFSFPVLLSELTDTKHDLVFIPVNNPDFHWSLLVFETKEPTFYHFDTLRGANDAYIKPLVTELLKQIYQTNQPILSDYLETRYHLRQGNSWDCGIAVIEIAKAIMKDYPTFKKILLYTKLDFNFPQARLNWRNKLINYYET